MQTNYVFPARNLDTARSCAAPAQSANSPSTDDDGRQTAGLSVWLQHLCHELAEQGFQPGKASPRVTPDVDVLQSYSLDVTKDQADYRIRCDLNDGTQVAVRLTCVDMASKKVVLSHIMKMGGASDGVTWEQLTNRLEEHRSRLKMFASYLSQAFQEQQLAVH